MSKRPTVLVAALVVAVATITLTESHDRHPRTLPLSRLASARRDAGGKTVLLLWPAGPPEFGDLPGGQAERIAVPEADLTLRKVPDQISDDVAVLLGDNLVTALDVLHRGRFEPGQVVAVLGAGAAVNCFHLPLT